MIIDQVKCDICGAIKGETNHWLIAFTHSEFSGIAFVPSDDAAQDRDGYEYEYQDICGQACAHKRLSQYLETLTPLTPKGSTE